MIKCFHHTDLDGHCSGAIVKHFLSEAKLYPLDYEDNFDFNLVSKDDTVYMIDVSLSVEEMKKLKESVYMFIFIDHHKARILELDNNNVELYGLQDWKSGNAACYLTWEFFSDKKVPKFIDLISRYDTWRHNENVLNFYYGVSIYPTDPSDKDCILFNLLEDVDLYDTGELSNSVLNIIEKGSTISKYIESVNKNIISKTAYVKEFEGLRFLVINYQSNSKVFDSIYDKNKHDGMIVYYYTGYVWKYSLYNNTDSEIDLSPIAIKYGGGGHMHACGFHTNKPIKELLN
jgi:oligoribonuclease NrnB/cAMP/cGMP phosphodiesterase (DHH superfamily)